MAVDRGSKVLKTRRDLRADGRLMADDMQPDILIAPCPNHISCVTAMLPTVSQKKHNTHGLGRIPGTLIPVDSRKPLKSPLIHHRTRPFKWWSPAHGGTARTHPAIPRTGKVLGHQEAQCAKAIGDGDHLDGRGSRWLIGSEVVVFMIEEMAGKQLLSASFDGFRWFLMAGTCQKWWFVVG